MKLVTTELQTLHLSTGEKNAKIYVKIKDVSFSLIDKIIVVYIEKGYIEDYFDELTKQTYAKDYFLSQNCLKLQNLSIDAGLLTDEVSLKVKDILLTMIAGNESFLSGMSAYTFE